MVDAGKTMRDSSLRQSELHDPSRSQAQSLESRIPCIKSLSSTSLGVQVANPLIPTKVLNKPQASSPESKPQNIVRRHEIRGVDALLLTHGHADAIFGLDDMRDFIEQVTRFDDFLQNKHLVLIFHQCCVETRVLARESLGDV